MEANTTAVMLKIYIGESDRVGGKLLYEQLVETARKEGLAGATVSRGILSFGASHSIHTMKIFALSADLPVIIEIVDSLERIEAFIPLANALMDRSKKGGLMISETVTLHRYISGEKYRKSSS
jgi:uncharacterized protein